MAQQVFPTRGFRRTRERASGLYFAFGVDDLRSELVTGQTLNLTRASGRTVFDSAGRVASVMHSQLAWSSFYNATDAIWEPALDVAAGTTNLCVESEDFSAGWTAIGTPTRTGAARMVGELALDLIGDDAAGTLEGYSRAVTFTGNAVKAVSIFVAQDTATTSVVRLRDTTAGANRLLGVLTWAAGLPVVTPTAGTYIGYVVCRGGFRLLFQSTSVTAANAHLIEIYPATTSALAVATVGRLYAGGVQVENAVAPGPYIRTDAATRTTARDLVTADITLPLSDFTVYMRVARPSWAGLTTGWGGDLWLFGPAYAGVSGSWALYFDPVGQNMRSVLVNAGAGVFASRAIPTTPTVEVCAQFINIATAPQTRLDVGLGFSAYSAAGTPIVSWQSAVTYLGGDATQSGGAMIRRAIVAPGARTLAQMRGLAV